MSLARLLAKLGYGTRKETERLLASRRVTTLSGDVLGERDSVAHDAILVDGVPLDPPAGSVLMLNKPAGYVCSTSDRPPLVYELLSPRFLLRDPVMATVGRLDAETTGMLLLTDDGPLNHQLTSPRWHLPKTYEVVLAEPLRGDEGDLFASGTLMLNGESAPLRPAQLEVIDAQHARLTIHEGRYHQVRRMFASTGNSVQALRRTAFGPLALGDLAEGAWRSLTGAEIEQLRVAARAAKAAHR